MKGKIRMSDLNPQHELARQLYIHVITPALSKIGFNDQVSRILVLATACKESDLQAIVQYGNGPAVSLWQMEPATIRDTVRRLPLFFSGVLSELAIDGIRSATFDIAGINNLIEQLPGNLYLGAAMCRLIYYLKPFKLDIVPGSVIPANGQSLKLYLAHIYKMYYNTPQGAATEAEFIVSWDMFALDSLVETVK